MWPTEDAGMRLFATGQADKVFAVVAT